MIKDKDYFIRVLNSIIGKIEDRRNNSEMVIEYCKGIMKQLTTTSEGKC